MCNRLDMSGCVVGSCRYGNVVFVSDSGLRAAPRSEPGLLRGMYQLLMQNVSTQLLAHKSLVDLVNFSVMQ